MLTDFSSTPIERFTDTEELMGDVGDEAEIEENDFWSVVSFSSDSEDENWLSVEQDLEGNIHVMSVNSDGMKEVSTGGREGTNWELVQEDYSVILSSDKKAKRKLHKKGRVETLAVGVTGVALAATCPTPAALLPFLLLSSSDLIKLGIKGRITKLPMEQRNDAIQELLRRITVKNTKLSMLSIVAASVSKAALYSLPLPLVLLQQLSFWGVDINTLEIAEKALTGMVSTISSQMYLKDQNKGELQKKKDKKPIQNVVWSGVSGMAGGVIGPVLNSPIAEKCLTEACSMTAHLSEQVLSNQV